MHGLFLPTFNVLLVWAQPYRCLSNVAAKAVAGMSVLTIKRLSHLDELINQIF